MSYDNNSYNTYDSFPMLPYNIMTYLFSNDNIFKLLKYNSSDALSKPNLTDEEKRNLIYKGKGDSSNFRLFQDSFSIDAFDTECTFIRVFPYGIIPINKVNGIIDIFVEVITHASVNYLDGYMTRIPYMTQQIISTLNGKEIGATGVMSFDRTISSSNMSKLNIYNNKSYIGTTTVFNVRVVNIVK